MAKPPRARLVRKLLDDYGTTVADELRVPIGRNTPSALFQLLCATLLLSARIPAANATRASRALIDAGLTTPRRMAEATWQQRVDVITWHGYKRFDERTARMLGEMAERVQSVYRGDLRRLRDAAERDPACEKALVMEFKGIGPTGGDIFLREVQVAWDEVYPFADQRVLNAAKRLGLGSSARTLARLVSRPEFAHFTAALLRVDLQHAYDEVLAAA